MNKHKINFFLILFLLPAFARAQYDNDKQIKLEIDGVTITSVYDSINFCSNLIVTASDNTIMHKEDCIERVSAIHAEDLDANGKNEIMIETFTGGAHCCTSLYIAQITGKKFEFLDTVYWGNCYYYIDDLNKDGKKEIIGRNDMFAYYFTNFSMSRFPIFIYSFRKNKLKLVNTEFKSTIYKNINDLKDELKLYKTDGFECPKSDTADVFNTAAGAVQAILAAITADYYYIGESDEGYDFINKTYTCPDKNKFIRILRKEFKLK